MGLPNLSFIDGPGIRLRDQQIIKNLTIEMRATKTAVFGLFVSNILIENCTFNSLSPINTYNTAIDIRSCRNVWIKNCTFNNWGASAIRSGISAGLRENGTTFDSMGEGNTPTTNLTVTGCTFNNCYGPVIGFKHGGTQYAEIRKNKFNNFKIYGVSCEGENGLTSNIQITDNYIKGGANGNTWTYGIYVGENAYKIEVTRNVIEYEGVRGGAICVSTSPSQGDTPVCDVNIYKNKGEVWVCPGDTNIYDLTCDVPYKLFYPDPKKTKGKVL